MAALSSLVRLSIKTSNRLVTFFVAVSDVEPLLSHVDGLIDSLQDSNPEKQYFRALVGLARATTLFYEREEVSDGFVYGIREQLVRLLHAHISSRYVLYSSVAQDNSGDNWHRSNEVDVLTALNDTCSLLALNTSCLPFYKYKKQVEFAFVLESAYFLLVFCFLLLRKLSCADWLSSKPSLHAHISILFLWLESVMDECATYNAGFNSCDAILFHTGLTLCNGLR